jgi:hypothetical protein
VSAIQRLAHVSLQRPELTGGTARLTGEDDMRQRGAPNEAVLGVARVSTINPPARAEREPA